MPRVRIATVAVLALLVTACGGSQEQEYADAIAASVQQNEAQLQVSPQQAQCVGDSFVRVLGVGAFEQADITPEEIRNQTNLLQDPSELGIDAGKAGELFDGLNECMDLTGLVLQGLAQNSSLSPKARACLAEAFDQDLLRRLFVASLTQGSEGPEGNKKLAGELLGAVSQCSGTLSGG